ncbi:hypothetical protein [Gloeocapsopsis sp. IPPAS B-1203]|uniref:hypothetical protein n=1 Tax=Gloeocapsopsis sp. IPPAS B-1203 TaxID=2049454 RepID=UPI000C19F859|nr:hypothetical protein [Gloeocapsopsis sp. IPPAS B-1203]PIG91140.1 hypothetical protein CSQ79_23240 [Gloeocapsopsis sp. IPPAS B-1203]
MDDNQSTQQSSQQRSNLQLARARRRSSAKSSALSSLFALLLSPWLLWPLLWLILLLIATLSIFSLTFTGFVDRVDPVPLVAPTPETATSGSDRIAIWVVGAIVACAAGYGVVFRQLQGSSSQPKRQRRQRRTRKRLPRISPRVETSVVEPTISVPPPKPSVKVTESVEPPPVAKIREPQISEPPTAEVKDTIPISDSHGSSEDPRVTILPPEELQAVDVEKVSLAEMMDIRKHRPLSSILGKTYDE